MEWNINQSMELSGDQLLDSKISEWIRYDKNEKTLAAIKRHVNEKNFDFLRSLLLERQVFGTAGIRGKMSAGYSAMNDLVIIQTSQGLAEYLIKVDQTCRESGVVIGFDGRHNSRRFAHLASIAFLQRNFRVYLYDDLVPTPFVPFGVKYLKACAGVMVTASHNPKDDNGYKVYFSNGAQIRSPHDVGIQKSIEHFLEPWKDAWNLDLISKCINKINEVKEKYYENLTLARYIKELKSKTDICFTFTSLHGVGHKYLVEAFEKLGFSQFHSVPEQQEPDPEFPTVHFPNPEEGKGVLNLAIQTAERTNSSIILAVDPDADRCSVSEKDPQTGKFRIFTGNEIGCLLGWWFWTKHVDKYPNCDRDQVYMISSAVSSKILSSIASKEGFNFIETLTGFKWMGNQADELLKTGKTVLFAFEEAIGYMCGSTILDKDGIAACIEVAQLTAYLKQYKSLTLGNQLVEIYRRYGYHCCMASYYLCYDQPTIKSIFHRLCNFGAADQYPQSVESYRIVRVRDLQKGYDSGTPDKKPILSCSSSSYMITFYFECDVTLTIRTSGTEPKIKYYSEAIASTDERTWSSVEQRLKDVVTKSVELFLEPRKNGLKPKSE